MPAAVAAMSTGNENITDVLEDMKIAKEAKGGKGADVAALSDV